jgi:hypothetical protein
MPENESVSKKISPTKIGLIILGVAVVALLIRQQFAGAVAQERDGTITSINAANREATMEIADPANGATREYQGHISPTCVITINGKPAKMEDLLVGDRVHVRALIDRKVRPEGDKKRPLIVAEQVDVTRKDAEKQS